MTRRSKTEYFKEEKNAPPPLSASTKRKVRFEEVDSLGIVWHGRYPSFFEDSRDEFGNKYQLEYFDMTDDGFIAPIVKLHVDYHLPLHYKDVFYIHCSLHWTDAAKLNFSYRLFNKDKLIIATGYTVQVFTDLNGKPLLLRPVFVDNFFNNWEELLKT